MGLYPWFFGFLLEGATLIGPSPIFFGTLGTPQPYGTALETQIF